MPIKKTLCFSSTVFMVGPQCVYGGTNGVKEQEESASPRIPPSRSVAVGTSSPVLFGRRLS